MKKERKGGIRGGSHTHTHTHTHTHKEDSGDTRDIGA
jgi:hypothetical protein